MCFLTGSTLTAWHQLLYELVDLFGLLALPAALCVDDIGAHTSLRANPHNSALSTSKVMPFQRRSPPVAQTQVL